MLAKHTETATADAMATAWFIWERSQPTDVTDRSRPTNQLTNQPPIARPPTHPLAPPARRPPVTLLGPAEAICEFFCVFFQQFAILGIHGAIPFYTIPPARSWGAREWHEFH